MMEAVDYTQIDNERYNRIRSVRRSFNDQRIARQLCYLLYVKGFMNGVLTTEIQNSLLTKQPNKPKYNVHHVCPTSLEGQNDFSNLTVIDVRLHKFVHECIFSDEIVRKIRNLQLNYPDISYQIFTPQFPPIATMRNSLLSTVFYATRTLISLGCDDKIKTVKKFFFEPQKRHTKPESNNYNISEADFDDLIDFLHDSKDVPWSKKSKVCFIPKILDEELNAMRSIRLKWKTVCNHFSSSDRLACSLIGDRKIYPNVIVKHNGPQNTARQYNLELY